MKLYLKFICLITSLISFLPNNVEAIDLDVIWDLAYNAFMCLLSSSILVFLFDQIVNHPENFRHGVAAYFE
jgi:hypothetical protein